MGKLQAGRLADLNYTKNMVKQTWVTKMEYTGMSDEWYENLIAARKALEAATENYNTQVDLYNNGATSQRETVRAYHQKQQAYENEREIFHQAFPCP